MSTVLPLGWPGPVAVPRTRTVETVAKLAGAYFAMRGVVVLLGVRLLHLKPGAGSALALALGPALFLLLCFHSAGAADTIDPSAQKRLWRSPAARCLLAYLAFAGASLLWTVAVSPLSSGAYWCSLLVDVAIVSLLLSRYTPPAVAGNMLRGYLFGACALAGLAWIMPTQADLRLGDPEFFNTNQIANICAFGFFFAQYLGRRHLARTWLPALFLGLTLVRTLSKTTLLAFLLSQSVLLFRDPNITRQTRRRVLLCTALVFIGSFGLLAAYYSVYTNAGNQAETLTGRTAIWAWTVDKLPEHPWIGHGFDSMWKVMPPFGIDRFEARHAENELLQQLYAYGIVGSLLAVAVYLTLYRSLRRLADTRTRPLLKTLVLFILVRGLAEAEPFDLLLPSWLILLLAAIVLTDGVQPSSLAAPV